MVAIVKFQLVSSFTDHIKIEVFMHDLGIFTSFFFSNLAYFFVLVSKIRFQRVGPSTDKGGEEGCLSFSW